MGENDRKYEFIGNFKDFINNFKNKFKKEKNNDELINFIAKINFN
jgi:hypothetical protein